MDTTDPDITFDEEGVSHWWNDFHRIRNQRPPADQLQSMLDATIKRIKDHGRGKQYDCILGLSGGVDSSYMAYLAKRWGLRPLVVHFDNGWNDELAVCNIEKMVRTLGFDLYTFVMDWPEFRDLQRSYFLASVRDLEVPTDHMICGALHKIASRKRIKFILSGANFATEWLLPQRWIYTKFDLVNLRRIHRRYGKVRLRHLPRFGIWHSTFYGQIRGIESVAILDLIEYKKLQARQLLIDQFGWRDYGGKHYESIFTRFYQGYILPRKFDIDKRRAHLSNLICNGEITRNDAIEELKKPPYDVARQLEDKRFVAKKLGWTEDQFEEVLSAANRDHEVYGTDLFQQKLCHAMSIYAKPFMRLLRRFRISEVGAFVVCVLD